MFTRSSTSFNRFQHVIRVWTISYHKLFSLFDHFISFDANSLCYFIIFTPSAVWIFAFWWRVDITAKMLAKIVFAINDTIFFAQSNNSEIARILSLCVFQW